MTIKVKLILLAIGSGAIGILWFLLGHHKALAPVAIAAQEAYQLEAIKHAKTQADALMSSANVDQKQVDALQAEIRDRKASLSGTYQASEMSTDEIVARFKNLGL